MSKGLSSVYLNKLMKDLNSKSFIGTYPINKIPKLSNYKKKISLIVNLDPSFKKGSHWVSIFCINGQIIYFDSFGRKPNKIIYNILLRSKKKIIYNKKKVQSVLSNFCGFYCIGFILSQERGFDLKKFLNTFFN